MTRYTDDELRAILAEGESTSVEFEAAWTRPIGVKARETVCAFANDLVAAGKPGLLFVGIRDDGTPSGISVDDALLLRLSEMKSDGNIVPPPRLEVQKRKLDGHEYALVIVEPSEAPPVRYDGRIHVRSGPRRDVATAEDERVLREKNSARDLPADQHPVPDAPYQVINRRRFELAYLPAAFSADVLEANERTYEQRLAALKLITPLHRPPLSATVAGCLALVDDATRYIPGAYVQWLRIRGTSLADPKVDEARGSGHVEAAITKIDGKLEAYNHTEVDYVGVPRERRYSPYPVEALKELLRNAVMHRTYPGGNAPVQVYWYDDRVEITNPGGPYGAVTVDNFGEPGTAAYRNPTLAEAMRVLNLVQRFGSGISVARSLCAANGNPPIEFDVTSARVRVVVRAATRPW